MSMRVRPDIQDSKPNKHLMRPDFIAKSVVDIDFSYIKKLGITTLFIDLDGTVVSRGTYEVSSEYKKALVNSGMQIHIATNRPKSRSLKTLKEDLHATSVIHPRGIFGKPAKSYYENALKSLGLKKSEVVMMGDRYIQDIWGANRAGIYSLVVFKLGKSKAGLDKFISNRERKFTEALLPSYTEASLK